MFVLGPIVFTLVSAREGGHGAEGLGKLARLNLPFEAVAETGFAISPTEEAAVRPALPGLSANAVAPSAVPGSRDVESSYSAESQSFEGVNESSDLAQVAASGGVPATLVARHGSAGARDTARSDTGRRARQSGSDARLRNRFLWRAWMESGSNYHARRVGDGQLLVYHPEEGYAVMRAAYQPMIQPVEPRGQRAPQDRSVYMERRQRREGPEDSMPPATTEAAETAERRVYRPNNPDVLGAVGGNSFQPWDPVAFGEPFSPANALVTRVPGLRIEQVVLFQGFSSNSYPFGRSRVGFIDPNLGYDLDVGALATVSWTRSRPTSSFQMRYTPSHVSRLRISEWNTTGHQLGLSANKRFARMSLSAGTNAGVRGLPQVLFTPAVLRGVPEAPGSFDDLVAAAGDGQLSSDEVASVLTGAPVVESHSKTKFDQGQVLATSAHAGMSYSHSPRLSSDYDVRINRFQTLSLPETDDTVVGLRGLHEATSMGASAGLSYQASPSTTYGVNSTLGRSYSTVRRTTSLNTMGTVRHRLGRNWSVTGGAGVGTVSEPQRLEELGQRSTWIVKGAADYTGRAHAVRVSASRTAGDTLGLGGRTSQNVSANWRWARPGSEWGLYGRAQWYDISIGNVQRGTRGALVGAGLTRRLTRETSFQADYSYQSFQSPFRGVVSNLSGHRIQMSWVWRPAPPR
jgi:hypothetical protein